MFNIGVLNMASVRVKLSDPEQLEALLADWKAAGKLSADALPERDPLGFLVHGDVDSVVSAGYRFASAPEAVSTVLTGTAQPQTPVAERGRPAGPAAAGGGFCPAADAVRRAGRGGVTGGRRAAGSRRLSLPGATGADLV